MRVQTLRSVPFTEVLSRLPDEVDRNELLLCFSELTHFTWGTNIHTLVPWNALMDDLADCFVELGWERFDVNHVFPADIFTTAVANDPYTFVDLEN